MSNLVQYRDIPEEIKVSLQDEIDKIGDTQNPEKLYKNIVGSSGTVGQLANLFSLPFGLVMKIREINNKV